MDVDLRTLDYVAATARYGSFAAAARSLGVTQPSISRPIRKLERKLGVALFAASGQHRLKLTEAGLTMLKGVELLAATVNEICERTADVGREPTGELTLAAPPVIGQYLLPKVIPEFMLRFPKVKLRIIQGYSGNIEEWLLEGRADLAIFHGNPRSADIDITPLAKLLTYLVAPARKQKTVEPLLMKKSVSISEISDVPLILPAYPSALRSLVDSAALGAGITPNVILEVDHQPLLRQLVSDGLGCTVLAFEAIKAETASGLLHAIVFSDDSMVWPVSIAKSSTRYSSLAIQAMSAMIKQKAGQLIESKALWGSRRFV